MSSVTIYIDEEGYRVRSGQKIFYWRTGGANAEEVREPEKKNPGVCALGRLGFFVFIIGNDWKRHTGRMSC